MDHLFVVEDYSFGATRTRYHDRAVRVGGMVTTALAQAARLGCRTRLLSLVGDDDDGRWMRRELRALGVGTRGLRSDPRFGTPVASIFVRRRDGERRFLVADRRGIEKRAAPLPLPAFDRRTLLLLDGHFLRTALPAARAARRAGATVIGDFNDARPAFLRLLPYVDYPIVPAEFARSWGRGDERATLRALRDEFGGTPVVTRGARGALALLGGRLHAIPARRVRVRDTTGAGDVFHGAFAAGLYHGSDEKSIQTLDALEHIRLRSGMYIGRLGTAATPSTAST